MPRTGNALSERSLLENLEACLPMHYPRFLKVDQPSQAMIPWMHQLYTSWWPASGASSLVRSFGDLNIVALLNTLQQLKSLFYAFTYLNYFIPLMVRFKGSHKFVGWPLDAKPRSVRGVVQSL